MLKRRTMKSSSVLLALLATAVTAAAAPVAPPDDKAAFAELKSLAGTWRGHSDCQGVKTATVVYRVISGGSTVMETLNPGTKMEMQFHDSQGDRNRCGHDAGGHSRQQRQRRRCGFRRPFQLPWRS